MISPWRFASKRFDPESGLIFFGRRYYSPTVGRFLTPDPIGFTDGPNLYSYVHNCPLILVDPYGLLTMEDAKESSLFIAEEAVSGYMEGSEDPLSSLSKYGGLGIAGEMLFDNDRGPSAGEQQFSSMTEQVGYAARAFSANISAGVTVVSYLRRPAIPIINIGKAAVKKAATSLMRTTAQKVARQGLSKSNGKEAVTAPKTNGNRRPRKYTENNYKKGLIDKTGINPGPSVEAHHIFPQQHEHEFLKKDINIHEPNHLAWLEKDDHRRNAAGYNKSWADFFEKNSNPTREQIFDTGRSLMSGHTTDIFQGR